MRRLHKECYLDGDVVIKLKPTQSEWSLHNGGSLCHPHIVKCLACREAVVGDTWLTERHLVLEYCSAGTLPTGIDEQRARRYFSQLLEALDFLHTTLRIAHNDIKPGNVFIDAEDCVKLGDFGFASHAAEPVRYRGTPNYMSPEAIKASKTAIGRPKTIEIDAFAADIWAVGVSLYTVLVNHAPFEDSGSFSRQDTFKNITRLCYTRPDALAATGASEAVIDLIQRILVTEPAERLTLRQVREHRWFASSEHRRTQEAPPVAGPLE